MKNYNEFNKMFHKTCYLLGELAETDSDQTHFKKPFYFKANEREQELVKYLFRKSLNISDGTDGDDGALPLELIQLLDVSYEDKTVLREDVRTMVRYYGDNEQGLLENLLFSLDKFLNRIELDEETTPPEKQMRTSLSFPYVKSDNYAAVRRLIQLRQFAYNKQKDSSYFPTLVPFINTSEFEGLNRYELASLFSKENFYSLSKQQVMSLMQATANNFWADNDTQPCAVLFEDLPMGNGMVTFGEYDPNRGAIIMNKKVLDLFEVAKDQDMQSYAYHMLSTLIHEATHRVQFSNLDKSNLSIKDAVVVQALMDPQLRRSFAEYLSAPEELDARQSALEYIKDCAETTNNPAMMGFYNVVLSHEKRNAKAPVDGHTKQLFSTLYSGTALDGAKNMNKDHAKYKRLLSESSHEPTL